MTSRHLITFTNLTFLYNVDCDTFINARCKFSIIISTFTFINLDIKNGMSTMRHFYCYPNTTLLADDTHDTTAFCERRTRLVLATLLGDEVTYYPITLPKNASGALESNKRYIISDVKITGPGVDDPEDPIGERGTVTYNVTILDWETGETWIENY